MTMHREIAAIIDILRGVMDLPDAKPDLALLSFADLSILADVPLTPAFHRIETNALTVAQIAVLDRLRALLAEAGSADMKDEGAVYKASQPPRFHRPHRHHHQSVP